MSEERSTVRIQMEFPVTQLAKADPDKMLVFGFANVSVTRDGKIVTDKHGDQILPDVLEAAAYKYVLRSREGGVDHEEMGVARLVESCFLTKEKVKAMGLKDSGFKGAGWWVGFKVDDPEVWERVKKGELRSFSIGGVGSIVESNT